MAPEKFFFVPGLAVTVIDRPELAVGGGVLHHKGQIRHPAFCVLDGGMSGIPPLRQAGQSAFQFSIAVNAVLHQEVHGPGGLFQIVQLRPMREPGALLCLDVVLNVNEQADPSVMLLRLPGWSGASGDPGGDGFLRVVHAQGFHPGKPLLIRGPAGNVFAPLDLIPFPLQAEQQLRGNNFHSRCVPFTRPAGVREYEKRRSRQLRPMPNRYMTHKERRVFLQPFKCYKNTRHGAGNRT